MRAVLGGRPTVEVAAHPATKGDEGEPWRWFGPLMLAMGLAFVGLTLAGWSSSTALAERGVPATATIVSKYTMPAESGREFRVKYAFAASDGTGRTGDEIVSQARYDTLEIGAPLAVVYLAEDPGVSTLAPYDTPPVIMLLAVLAFEALCIAIGAWFTWRRLSGWMERRA